jgi:hypothetical protein
MINAYAVEKMAEQRRQQDERAAAAYRLALQAERTARAHAPTTAPRVGVVRLLGRIARVVVRWSAWGYNVTPKPQAR